jgi:hypothetical protein
MKQVVFGLSVLIIMLGFGAWKLSNDLDAALVRSKADLEEAKGVLVRVREELKLAKTEHEACRVVAESTLDDLAVCRQREDKSATSLAECEASEREGCAPNIPKRQLRTMLKVAEGFQECMRFVGKVRKTLEKP